ncbi:DUF4148 domain-containing protein [Massilia suwonensis]|uniref:DUF4148 domain-containing protein n=1 Tax=Massilia suwonensis TaxID=648895 RepID=A0ABW0MLK5_9BURK
MSAKYLIPALLVSLVAGSASAAPASADPVRARVVAELEQAKQSGNYPPSEADYVYPNWVKIANPAGVVMTDGHLDNEGVQNVAARGADTATPVALMSDGHPELENRASAPAARPAAVAKPAVALMTDASQGTVKGGDSVQ